MAVPKVFTLQCAVKNNAWGSIGTKSEVALLRQGGDSTFELQDDMTYAELWMGTHVKGDSILTSSEHAGKTLSQWVEEHPDCLGSKVRSKFNDQLPYLFKVLSINKTLSIQAHPNKTHAEQLNAKHPDIYVDDNHKPEMALALTPFEGMNGFKRLSKIVHFLEAIPEFRTVVGEKETKALQEACRTDPKGTSDSAKAVLKKSFTSFMNRDESLVSEQLDKLEKRFQKLVDEGQDISNVDGEIFLRLCKEYPGDAGSFVSYFFNVMTLKPGEAMFLQANEPHAYMSGDCIECMACSDNVVRAGLTAKYKDVPTLCEMLSYITSTPEERIFDSHVDPSDPCVTIYNPAIPDFAIAKVEIPAETRNHTLGAYDSGSIVLFIRGSATATSSSISETLSLRRGSVIFVAAGESVQLNLESNDGLLAFRAYCPLD
ncbi:mannose-6-phosphate isomerase-like [Apostichopus japonicus]|uniref:mannose-6-phosphate isomerase-like n=1 Tax=Stichopus japonicus TaxID=307972 RepID=UPI003AB25F08